MNLQAHFWEVQALNDKDGFDTDEDTAKFERYVLNVMKGTEDADDRQWAAPVDWSLFQTNVRVIWMTPVKMGDNGQPQGTTPKYQEKLERVNEYIEENVDCGDEVVTTTFLYERLNYRHKADDDEPSGQDAAYVNKGAYGMCAFQ